MTVHVFIFQALFATYGVDWSGPPPSDVLSNDTVVVPDTNCPLTPTEMAELQSQYNPLGPCDDVSINMYLDVLQFTTTKINTRLQQGTTSNL